MKKIVLLLCALIGISVGMAAGPVEQSPAKRLITKQTKPATELQTPPANVTLRKGDAQLQLAKPGAKAIAPVKAKRAKAPARADETTGEAIVTFDATGIMNSVLQQNADFTVTTTLYNEGTADFNEQVQAVLLIETSMGFSTVYATDYVTASVPQGGSTQVSIPGHIDGSLIEAGIYYMGIATTTEYLVIHGEESANIIGVEVLPDPSTSYILSVTNDATFPETLNQNEDGTLTVEIENTGGLPFSGNIVMALLDPNSQATQVDYNTSMIPTTIAANSSETVNIPYYISSSVQPGEYMMLIGTIANGYITFLPLSNGSDYVMVEVMEKEGPDLSMSDESIPASIMQGVEFTVTGTVANAGADFNGKIGVVLTDYDGNIYYESEYQDAAIARNESLPVEIKGTVGSDVAAGTYYLYVVTANLDIIGGGDAVTVEINPDISPILSWETAEMPETICQNQDFTVSGTISNTGADFTGQVGIALVQQDPWSGQAYIMYESDYQDMTVAKDGNYDFTATCNVGDLATGEYYLYVGYDDGEYFNAISGGNAVTVSPNPEAAPVLSLVEAESSIPEAIAQNTEFTITAVVRNDGQAFNGSITLQIADFYNPYYTDTKAVSIANGESQTLTFTGTLDAAEVPASDYYLDILWEDEEGNFDYLYNTYVTVEADPTLPVLQIVETEELNADSYLVFLQNTDVPFSILVENTGGSTYEGEVFMAFVDYFENILFRTEAVNATIPAGEQQTLDFVINVGNMDTGLYDMALMYNENTIANMSDSYYSTFFVEVSDPTSISDTGAATFTVGPNPAAGHVDVACGEGIQSVRIYSLSGSLLMQEEAEGKTCRLDISALPQGAYLLNIVTADGATKTERLIKR